MEDENNTETLMEATADMEAPPAEAGMEMEPVGDEYQAMEEVDAPPPPLLRRQTTTFAAYRQNVTAMEKTLAQMMVRQYSILLVMIAFLYYFTTFAEKRATSTKNSYTLNHIKFNQWYFELVMKGYLVVILVQIMKLHDMPHNRCLRYINTFVFVCIRLVLAVYYCFWIIPGCFWMYCFAMTLQKQNYWHSKNDPWITNCSPYNAFICWVLWLAFEFMFYVLCVYAVLFAILLVVGLVKLSKNPAEGCKGIKTGLNIMWELFMSYLFAKQIDLAAIIQGRQAQDNQNLDDSFERETKADNFIMAHTIFNTKSIDPEHDCPICLEQFAKDSEIIALSCSNKHIFHIKCIEDYLKDRGPDKKCALCREPINFDEEFFIQHPEFQDMEGEPQMDEAAAAPEME